MGILDKLLKKEKKEVVATTVVGTDAGVKKETVEQSKPFIEGLVSTKDIIAPSALEVDFDNVRIDGKYYRTLFVAGYPRFVGINWLSPLINFDASLTISMYIYPTDGKEILDDLRRKIAEMGAEISTDIQRGRVVNPATQAKLEDAMNLQADLVKGVERFFQFGLYATVAADTREDLNRINKNLEAALGSLLIISKKATLQMEEGFVSTLPIANDKLGISRNMDTTSLATTFPFVSSDLSDDRGVMYGINMHNGSLVIFDRFSMQNYNSVVFATAGAGKSYLIKLEALRSLMLGTEIIVIDPENEYKDLCEAVGGQYVAFGYSEDSKINPFDLSLVEEEGENALNSKILSLHKLFSIMLGKMDPIEESILDRAIMDAYKMKGVTPDPETQTREPPLIEDLYKSLIGMEEEKAQGIAARLEKYIKGSFGGIFNQKTTVNLDNKFVVFGIRNMEEALRPVAMNIILDYIWTIVKKSLKKRILIVDEAWYLMQYEDSAAFLRGIVKRGRKYYLGVTTITQDVDDFLETPYGKEIVTNSAIQILLKQHSAAIDKIGEVFYLSEGEKQLLLTAYKGEGIFFAGQNHVAINVIASADEHALITSNPEEIMKMKLAAKKEQIPVADVKLVLPPNKLEDKIEQNPIPLKDEDTSGEEVKTAIAEKVAELPAEVVVETNNDPETMLQRRIKEMQEQEQKELEEHKIKTEAAAKIAADEETKANSNFGTLPKYQDLFKSKLPPLPPLPKYEPPVPTEATASKSSSPTPASQETPLPKFETPKAEVVNDDKKSNVILNNKPIFINQAETKIPQPPQLQKKINPVFVSEDIKPEVTSENKDQKAEEKKMDYDKLFGNGIV